MAPKARILDVRVANPDGSTSVIQVLRGLDVVASTGKLLGVKVLNLSLSSGSPLPYQVDPLTMALDALWHSGVTVVVPAGNNGNKPGTISSPGVDPTLITAGALDEAAPVPGRRHRRAVLRPRARATGRRQARHRRAGQPPGVPARAVLGGGPAEPTSRIDDAYFRGSGTSMATAVTNGAIAHTSGAAQPVAGRRQGTARPGRRTPRPAGSAPECLRRRRTGPAGCTGGSAHLSLTRAPASPAPPGPAWRADAFSCAASNHHPGALVLALRKSRCRQEARSWIARSSIPPSPTARSRIDQHWDAALGDCARRRQCPGLAGPLLGGTVRIAQVLDRAVVDRSFLDR